MYIHFFISEGFPNISLFSWNLIPLTRVFSVCTACMIRLIKEMIEGSGLYQFRFSQSLVPTPSNPSLFLSLSLWPCLTLPRHDRGACAPNAAGQTEHQALFCLSIIQDQVRLHQEPRLSPWFLDKLTLQLDSSLLSPLVTRLPHSSRSFAWTGRSTHGNWSPCYGN